MPWGFIAAGVGSLIGGALSGAGAQSAGQEQAQAAEQALQLQQQEFNTITQQESPFIGQGYGAGSALDYLLGIQSGKVPAAQTAQGAQPSGMITGGGAGTLPSLNGTHIASPAPPTAPAGSNLGQGYGSLLQPFTADYMKQYSPAYQFQLQQGQEGVLNGDTSGVGALSGAAQKDLMGYNQNLANTAFGNAFNQYQTQQGNVYSRLMGLTQLGQGAAANLGTQGANLAQGQAQSAQNIGTALAGGTVGQANAYSGALQSAGYMPWMYQMSQNQNVNPTAGNGTEDY